MTGTATHYGFYPELRHVWQLLENGKHSERNRINVFHSGFERRMHGEVNYLNDYAPDPAAFMKKLMEEK